jgi:hypothetical protein
LVVLQASYLPAIIQQTGPKVNIVYSNGVDARRSGAVIVLAGVAEK